MKTEYKANNLDLTIEAIELDRSNMNSVWIRGRRRQRHTNYEGFFYTREKAYEWLMQQVTYELIQARRRLERAQGRVGNVKRLKG